MGLKLTNNAVSRLAAGISNSDLVLSVIPGDGLLFPSLSPGDHFPCTLLKSTGEIEIINVTARSVDVFTIERAQESTGAQSFNPGDRVELRLTAGAVDDVLQSAVDEAQALDDALAADLSAQIAALVLPAGFGPVPYSGTTAPTGWLMCYGQAISRTTYAALFAAIGTVFGVGDGSTTFNIPDMRGRVPAGVDNMGGSAASRLTGTSGGVAGSMGSVGGAEQHTLTTAQMPVHDHAIHFKNAGVAGSGAGLMRSNAGADDGSSQSFADDAGSGAAHNNVQPTLVTNYILKV